jgi:hypothetical protein
MIINHETNNDLFVATTLSAYLGKTRLSMEQVAKKWEVSSAMLSLVKNNKKSVGIDLGLKILRESGIAPVKRKQWLERKVFSLSEESKLVDHDLKNQQKITQIKSSICEQLGQSKVLLDIFLDITLSEDEGIPYKNILRDYGKSGIQKVETLITAGICRYEQYSYFVNDVDNIFAYDPRSSFEVVNNLIREQRLNFLNDDFKGKLEFDVTDISEDAYKELKALQKDYQKKLRQILSKNQTHRNKGGLRVFTQSIVSILKTTTVAIILTTLSPIEIQATGGVTGSAGDDKRISNTYMGGVTGSAGDGDIKLPTAMRHAKPLKINLGTFSKLVINGETATLNHKPFQFRSTHVKTDFFDNKEDAIRAGVDKQYEVATNTYAKDYLNIIANSSQRGKCAHYIAPKRKPLHKNFFRFKGFQLEESFDIKGNQRFRAKVNLDILCRKK